jgi:hypothetical protein
MPIKLPMSLPPAVFAVMLAGAATGMAGAASLGSGLSMPVLGQALDFSVQLRTEPGDPTAVECVSSEVMMGERRLASSAVRTVVEAQGPESARVRVTSTQAIDEPVVTITLTVGCTSRISRHYVLLADPPITAPSAPVPAFAAHPAAVPADAEPRADVVVRQATPVTDPSATRAAIASPPRPVPPLRSRAADGQGATAGPARAQTATRNSPTRSESAPRERRPAGAPKGQADAAPRLRLEVTEPVRSADALAVERALEAVAQAASAARAAASAASAASERIATLERTVTQLRAEASAQRDAAAQLRERLAQSEGAGRWVAPLLALGALLLALVIWLAWRLAVLQRQREHDWKQAVGPAVRSDGAEPAPGKGATAPIPFVTSEVAAAATRAAPVASAWPPAVPGETPATAGAAVGEAVAPPETENRRAAASSVGLAEFTAARDVSIEELIDLEQQAEFFVVLGQDEAAIDLLIEHLRHTGGSSPLPYLKLLEIHRRRGDREAYERMRVRFNRRFNAYAPEWGVDLAHGRTLEDYPGVIPRLQQVWARPMDAMAELEALLFRKSRGELFDLPAYREVLFLYSLARDLLDREPLDAGSVDLLLPLSDGTEFGTTASQPYLERDAMTTISPDDRVTAPLDLDVDRPERTPSLFDPLDDSPRAHRP